jgi:Tetracyclin repressor-like, C-terminal domain
MVMRYYGNKDGLFGAAVHFDLRLPDLSSLPRAGVGAAIVTHFLDRWESDETLMALLRAAVTNEAAAERMRRIFAEQLGPAIERLLDDPGQASRCAGLIATQLLGVALCRFVLRLPAVVGMTREQLVVDLGPTLQRYLVG